MPKMKTNRAAAKRFRKTGGKTIRRGKAYRRHILTKKSTARKRALRKPSEVDQSNIKQIKVLMPY